MKNNLKIQSYSLPDIKYSHLKPHEDSYQIGGNNFCLADGITRDPSSPIDFGDLTMTELLKNYPKPSPAKMAADCFCESVTGSLKGRTTCPGISTERFPSFSSTSKVLPVSKFVYLPKYSKYFVSTVSFCLSPSL